MSARNEMMKVLVDFTSFPGGVADEVLQTLTAAGYRILGPDELDPVTLEKAAQVVEADIGYKHGYGPVHHSPTKIASAIRALGRKA